MKKFYLSIIALVMTSLSFGQISGTFTIPGATYPTIASAIAALNASGVGAGGVTFNVTAAYTETFASATTGLLTITTNPPTIANQVIFQKSGAGVNPKITAGTGTGTRDAIICFNGVQYITFNGIDVYENAANTTTTTQMEWGYAVLKVSGTQGSQNITVKNCTISLNITNTATYGLYSNNQTPASATALTVTAFSGANSNNKFFGLTFANCYNGIYIYGYSDASPYAFYDQNNEIGKDGPNAFGPFSGGTATGYGIYGYYQNNFKLANNTFSGTIPNNTGGAYCVYLPGATNANFDIYNNTISMTYNGTGSFYGFYVIMGASGTSNITNTYNNSVTNCSFPNMAAGSFYGMYMYGGMTDNYYNNNVTNNTYGSATATATGTIYYMYHYSSPTTAGTMNVYGNTVAGNSRIQSVLSSGTCYHFYLSGGNGTMNAYNNTVNNQTIGSNSTQYIGYILYSGNKNFYNNTITNILNSNGGTLYVIYNGNGTGNAYFYNNKLQNINGLAAASVIYGFYQSSGTNVYIYNNYIAELKTPTSTSSTAIFGMYLSSATTIGAYDNTVYLNATSSSATTFGTAAIYASTGVPLDLRGNILINASTPGPSGSYTAALRFTSTTLTNYSALSNNNNLYAGTPGATRLIFYDGTNMDQTLAAFKARVSPRDAVSVTELPPFVNIAASPYDLHIQTTIATQCEGAGTVISAPVNITTDFDGQNRYPNAGYPFNPLYPPTLPDIGADEFGGIPLDLVPPSIVFTPFLNTSSLLARTLTTSITDPSGVPTSGLGLPRLYWKINSGSYNTVIANSLGGGQYTFTFGLGAVLGDVVSYYIVAQDNASTPNVGSNPSGGAGGFTINPPAAGTPPTTPYTYTIIGQICGSFNVGAGQTYTTLTAAIADLNNKEVTCPVTFVLMDANYAAETFPITINAIAGASAVNTITIKPGSGVTASISGSSATSLIKFNGASYVTINGSNSGGTDRSLTLTNTVTTGTTAVIWIGSIGTGFGSTNITIKNCNIANGYNVATSYDIFIGASSAIGTSGDNNDNLTIQNNALSSAYYGIYNFASSLGANNNLLISDNVLGSATVAKYLQYYGIYLSGANAPQVIGNEIYNMIGIPTYVYGIEINSNVINALIQGNKIHDLQNNNTGGWGAYGINIGTGANVLNATLVNNLIYNITTINYSTASTTYNPFGIRILGGTGHKLYNNSVNMAGTQFNSGSSGTLSAALLVTTTAVTGLDVRNNIFANSLVGLAGSVCYCVYVPAGFVFGTTNYNDYWPSGLYGLLGYFGATVNTLAAWQAATGQDANSLNIDPVFVSPTDLHPTAIGLQKACPFIPGVNTDYSSTLRTNPTDIGAYQMSSGTQSVTTNAATLVLATTATLNGSITANNLSVLSGFEYGPTTAYGTVVAGVPLTVTGNSATGISAPVTGLSSGTLYHFRAKGTSGAVIINGGDLTFTTTSTPPTVVTTAATLVTATTATVNGTVNANGASTTTSFDYGLTVAYGTNVPGVPLTVTGNSVTPVSAGLTGLLPGNTYHYRINGVNAGGTTNGNDMTFATPPAAPTAVTTVASGIGATTATLNGTVTANGASTAVSFDYGLTTAYTTNVAGTPSPVTGNTTTSVSAGLTGLGLTTTYHYRVNGVNSQGTTNGNDMTFTTGCPQAGPAGPITGPVSTCQGGSGYVYTVAPIANASGYNWTLPVGGVITAGNNTNTITVSYGPTALSGYVFVYGTAACGNGSPSQLMVTINPPASPSIAGPASRCVNSTGNVYTTQSGMTNYVWTVSAGGLITAGAGTNSITVTWNTAGAQTVCVNYNSAQGCPALAPVCYNVTVNPLPVPTVTGPNPACTTIPTVYSTEAGMNSYIWTTSAGGTITGGLGTNAITVQWSATGAQSITVNYTNSNGCTAAAPTNYPVTVNATTVPTVTGSNNLCANSGYYNYITQSGMSNYIWTVTSGGTITGGQGTNSLQVIWTTTGAQSISVIFTNANGCTPLSPTVYPVTVTTIPDAAGAITGTASVCAGSTGIAYSVAPINNALNYVWTLPAGATIASGSGTNSITVNYAMNASSGNITVYGNNICGNGTTSPPYAVTVTPVPDAAGTITGSPSVCIGATGVIYSILPIANATSYVWTLPAGATISGPSNTNSITVDFGPAAVSGVITVAGNNSCGSGTVSPDFAVTVNPIPPAPIIGALGDTLASSAPAGNQWYLEGVMIPGATGQIYIAVQTGHYWDVVTLNECSSDTSNHVYVVLTGISELSRGNTMNLYPNPSDGKFTLMISSTEPQTFDLSILNNLGLTIMEAKDLNVRGTLKKSIDLQNAPEGVYTIVLKNSKQQIVKKIVINK